MILRLAILFSSLYSGICAQDTLVLFQKKLPQKEYKIPLGQYSIKVKCKGHKKFTGILVSVNDSAFVFKVRNNSSEVQKQIKLLYANANDTAYWQKIKGERLDSLMRVVKAEEKKILYLLDTTINITQIEKFKIDNRLRPEKRRRMKNLQTIGLINLGAMLFIAPVIVLIAPLTVISFVVPPIYGLGAAFITIDIILKTQRLNFKTKWAVKKIIKA